MPTIFTPKPRHSCLRDSQFEVDLNKDSARRIVGEIWECPDCGNLFIWDGDERATVPRPYWSQISHRAADKIIQHAAQQGVS